MKLIPIGLLLILCVNLSIAQEGLWDDVEQKKPASSSSVKVESSSASTRPVQSQSIPVPTSAQTLPEEMSSSSVSSSSSSAAKIPTLTIQNDALREMDLPQGYTRKELLGKVKVTRVEAFNEQGAYKSPKTAALLSLILPGAGQIYVGGGAPLLRGAVYLGFESALWVGWYQYSVVGARDLNQQIEELKKNQWSDSLFESRVRALSLEASVAGQLDVFKQRYLTERYDWCLAIYGQNDLTDVEICNETSLAQFDNHTRKFLNPNTKVFSPSQQASLLVLDNFRLGWKDSKIQTLTELQLDQTQKVDLSPSSAQDQYAKLRTSHRERVEASGSFFGAMALNRIISAIDAVLAAKSRNQSLYKQNETRTISLAAPMRWNGQEWGSSLQIAWVF